MFLPVDICTSSDLAEWFLVFYKKPLCPKAINAKKKREGA